MITIFEGVSPPTLVVMAKVEDDLPPKAIVIQEKIPGLPACETPWARLMQREVLIDFKRILRAARLAYFAEGVYDLCGQKLSEKSLLKKVFACLPFFSDHIIISGNKASLVDNTPEDVIQEGRRSYFKKFVIKILVAELLIDSLVVLRSGWDRLVSMCRQGDSNPQFSG